MKVQLDGYMKMRSFNANWTVDIQHINKEF